MAGSVSIKFKDNKFMKGLEELNAEFPNAARAILVELAAESVQESKARFVPVDTGNLRSTIRVINTSDMVGVAAGGIMGAGKPNNEVDYAEYVNYGTSKQPPRLFMEKGVALALTKTDSVSRKILNNWSKALD